MAAGVLTVLLTALAPSLTQTAIANGDTRTINLHHAHTKETISATYLVNGQYDRSVLQQLNWFLRDWRRDEPTNMDPRLFDVVWEAYRHAGAATETVHVVSAYRSPETNAMLRSRSRAVAKYSQHMLGKAMDTTLPGMPMARVREIGMRMQRGGVGYYPSAGTPFVHLDVGNVRSWPRMSYDQLARLFPDGKTVHLPSNGQPLAGYEVARAEIEARNNGAYVQTARRSSGGFLAFLFGGGEEDEDLGLAAPPPSSRKQWASLAPRNSRAANLAAAESDEEGAAAPPEPPGRRSRSETQAKAESNLPRGETTLSMIPAGEATQPEKTTAVRAPLPPQRPASIDKPTPLDTPPASAERSSTVAALDQEEATRGLRSSVSDQNADSAVNAEREEATARPTAPLPPRRPATLLAALAAPLPPSRPTDLAGSAQGLPQQGLPRAASVADARALGAAKAKEASARTDSTRAANALADLIDATDPAATPGAGRTATTKVARSGEPPQAPTQVQTDDAAEQALLAYAPRPAAEPKAAAAKAANGARAGFMPARLDRSNFRAMTAATPASRASGVSVLGSSIGAVRSAARAAEPSVLAPPGSAAASSFAAHVAEPPTDKFAPDATRAE